MQKLTGPAAQKWRIAFQTAGKSCIPLFFSETGAPEEPLTGYLICTALHKTDPTTGLPAAITVAYYDFHHQEVRQALYNQSEEATVMGFTGKDKV